MEPERDEQRQQQAFMSGYHYGCNQPTVTDKHLSVEAKTRFGHEAERDAFIKGYKAGQSPGFLIEGEAAQNIFLKF